MNSASDDKKNEHINKTTQITFGKVVYAIVMLISIALAIGGFFVPPMGVIDGSVITTIGILIFGAMFAKIPDIIEAGHYVELNHGETKVSVRKNNKEE